MKTRLFLTLILFAAATASNAGEPGSLTDAEKEAGWQLLFDGKTTKGWRGYKMQTMPPGWTVTNGTLARAQGGAGGKGAGGGDDIVTAEEFDNFELSLEWKLVPNGNRGVLYHVSEEPVTAWHYAPEIQLLDNTAHRTRNPKQLAGACYDGARAEHWMPARKLSSTRSAATTGNSASRKANSRTGQNSRPSGKVPSASGSLRPSRVPQY